MHTDQGRNFESLLFKEVADLLGIEKTHTAPYHPQSDGQMERWNHTRVDTLAKLVNDQQTDWDEHIPLILMAYNSAKHRTTGFSPNELITGWKSKLPIDLLYWVSDPNYTPVYYEDYVVNLQDVMENCHEIPRKNQAVATEKSQQYYDSVTRGKEYKLGDAVWMRNTTKQKGKSPKLQDKFLGLYIVVRNR